jgi:transposase-like protein
MNKKTHTIYKIKNISLDEISLLSDLKIETILKEAKYGLGNKMFCSHCGSFNVYKRKEEKKVRYRCNSCSKYFSLTTNTIFDSHKLPLKKILLATVLFVNSAKGISSLQISRDLGVKSKTAFELMHKIRMALFNQYTELQKNKLKGTIQIDGAYINHKDKPKNKKSNRVDRKKVENNKGQECIMTLREINEEGLSFRSYAFIVGSENQYDIERLLDLYVEKGSTIVSDSHVSYDKVESYGYISKKVNHSLEYQTEDGINTNQAESYFSRLRRMLIGQHHRMSKKYLDLYVNEITYRENMRIYSNKDVLVNLLKHIMKDCNSDTVFNNYQARENSKIKDFKGFDRTLIKKKKKEDILENISISESLEIEEDYVPF